MHNKEQKWFQNFIFFTIYHDLLYKTYHEWKLKHVEIQLYMYAWWYYMNYAIGGFCFIKNPVNVKF